MSKLEEFKQLLSGGVSENVCLFYCNEDDRIIVKGASRDQSFKFGFDIEIIDSLLITYKQDNRVIFNKTLNDVNVFRSNTIYYTLNEGDTIKFNEKLPAQVQVKVKLKNGSIITSQVYILEIVNELTKEELTRRAYIYCNALDAHIVEQDIYVNKNYPLISGSKHLYKCKFDFDSSWDDVQDKIVIFKDQYHAKIKDIFLDNTNECFIPDEALEKPGLISISVMGSGIGYLRPTIWSNSIRVDLGGK